jgi:hypothetical protein
MIERRSFLIGLAALICAPGQAAAIAADELLFFFDTLALMRGRQRGEPRPGRVRKWPGPVVVRTRGVRATRHREAIVSLLAEVSGLSGLAFTLAPRVGPLDNLVTLYFLSRREMRRLYPDTDALCYTQTRSAGGGVLRTARVRIGHGFEDCLHHEFMHALGFDNHWPGLATGIGAPSALAGRFAPERARGFSEWDRMAIRLLYDHRLSPGMARNEALAVARRVIAELAAP